MHESQLEEHEERAQFEYLSNELVVVFFGAAIPSASVSLPSSSRVVYRMAHRSARRFVSVIRNRLRVIALRQQVIRDAQSKCRYPSED